MITTGRLVPITIKYVLIKSKSGMEFPLIVSPSRREITMEEYEKKYGDRIKTFTTHWEMPGWKEHNEIIKKSQKFDNELGKLVTDDIEFNSLCLERFLKAWDLVDDAGIPVPCNKANADKLNYVIASTILNMFFDYSIPSDEEMGN